ncbi:mitochondrial fission process protein 1 [Microplitis demolitor]|uniref:mitochondrial fission process protein 1 n=1 Tax=Microplitis demolitor TaxID=69319 RepID=UPI0004CDA0BC|nr:mitochondrial fission process protein 1 [Microplitis demolitor]
MYENKIKMDNKNTEVDIFRDTSLRYLGYTNEVGEAFRSIVPKSIVWMSYVIASGYVIADTAHKGIKEYEKIGKEDKNKRIILSASDTLIWQSFASVIIPGLVINRICAGVRFMQKNAKSPVMRNPWVSTIVGLISIPLIIRPIDDGVERTMDSTYRQWTGYHPQKEMDDK